MRCGAQVPISATSKEVKHAYYKLAKECHPDYLGDAGHNACILLNEAYEVLVDTEQRNWYDFRLNRAKEELDDGYTGAWRHSACVVWGCGVRDGCGADRLSGGLGAVVGVSSLMGSGKLLPSAVVRPPLSSQPPVAGLNGEPLVWEPAS
jgi:hypothetical protein